MSSAILVTGAATGIGNLTARTLAHAGHTVYASMRDVNGRNAARAQGERDYAAEHRIDLRVVELDVLSQAVKYEVARFGIDVVVVMPGAFTQGTEHFPNATHPADTAVAEAYTGLDDVLDAVTNGLAELTPPDAHPRAVAEEIARIV